VRALKLHYYLSFLTDACFGRVNIDEVDGIGHWVGNTRREVYSAKIPKAVSPVHPHLSILLIGRTPF
jgi:hypothetical protein